jgi:hypothetical protein
MPMYSDDPPMPTPVSSTSPPHWKGLERCGELTDAVAVAYRLLVWSFILAPVMVAYRLLVMMHKLSPDGDDTEGWKLFAVFSLIVIVILTAQFFAVKWVLRGFGSQDKCVFLRAFRSDRSSAKFRAWLAASLGPSMKLAGIRPPIARVSTLANLLNPLVTGLRYAGSLQFEMEAPDHNWLARLLATFAKTRFAFIDIRDVTPHVLDEIQLAWEVFGSRRCVFVVDDSRTATDWHCWLQQNLNTSGKPVSSFLLLEWPRDQSPNADAFNKSVRTLLMSIPAGHPAISSSALNFVRQKVSSFSWDIRFAERPFIMLLMHLLGVGVLSYGIRALLPVQATLVWIIAWVLLLHFLFWRAWNRARKQRRLALAINPAGPPSRRHVAGAAGLMTLSIGLGALTSMAIFSGYRFATQKASNLKTMATLLDVKMALGHYQLEFGEYPVAKHPDQSAEFPHGRYPIGGAMMLYQAITGDGTSEIVVAGGSPTFSDGLIDAEERRHSFSRPPNASQLPDGRWFLADSLGRPLQYELVEGSPRIFTVDEAPLTQKVITEPVVPVAKALPGKDGFVIDPHSPGSIVDVREMRSGTKVKSPTTGKVFKIP